jgi:hypothetical protein
MFSRRNFSLLLVGMTLLAAGLACALSGAQPNPAVPINSLPTAAPAVAPTHIIFPLIAATEPPTNAPQPIIPESRRLTLEYPPQIRVGDSDVIRLTLEADTLGNVTPTVVVKGNSLKGTIIQIPNVYDTHNVFAEARLDIAGPTVKPPEIQSEALNPGQSVTFYWSVQPTSAGTFRGTAWFYLRFVDKVSGAESQQALSAQPLAIDANSFLGLSGGLARVAGGIGSILGAVFGFPFADDILKWLFSRVRQSK